MEAILHRPECDEKLMRGRDWRVGKPLIFVLLLGSSCHKENNLTQIIHALYADGSLCAY